jgi:hypothetical protein
VPDLDFRVESAESDRYAASPLLIFKLRIDNARAAEQVQTITLRCQIQIDGTRRRYRPQEQARLHDLFGEPDRWEETLRPMLWTHTSAIVKPFTVTALVDLPVPCTFDFNIAATKYFAGLDDGVVPLLLQFSGTVFYAAEGGPLQVAQIPWSKESRYHLPIAVWQEMMEQYYPNSAWLCLRRDVFERLYQYKVERGLPTWERVIEDLLTAGKDAAAPGPGESF